MASGKKKKILIKAPTEFKAIGPQNAQSAWSKLKKAIIEIFGENQSGLSFEELYRNAYTMVLHKKGTELYNNVKSHVGELLKSIVAKELVGGPEELFLPQLVASFRKYSRNMRMVTDVLMYLDRSLSKKPNVLGIFDTGLDLYNTHVLKHKNICTDIGVILYQEVLKERRGEVMNRLDIKVVCQMLIDVDVLHKPNAYEKTFENQFLENSGNFYRIESDQYLKDTTVDQYLRRAEKRINEEIDRARQCFPSQTEAKIRTVVEKEMLAVHLKRLIDMEGSGLVAMLNAQKIEDLKRMYMLLGRITNAHQMISTTFEEHIVNQGRALIKASSVQDSKSRNTKDGIVFVQQLIDLYAKYNEIFSQAFMQNKQFLYCLNNGFNHFVNEKRDMPELLSLYLDHTLRSTGTLSDVEIDSKFNYSISIFKYLDEKDLFEKYYKTHLAKRLLALKNYNDDAERSMITKLKNECGYQFTSKLEGMFTDMKLSIDTNNAFSDFIANKKSLPGFVDISVQVLTCGFWPTAQTPEGVLPSELKISADLFKDFYLSNHNGRRLTWQPTMGSVEIRGTFDKSIHDITVSTTGAIILLLFNRHESLKFAEISNELAHIPAQELKRMCQSLALAKYKVLTKEPKGRDVNPDDEFRVNAGFKCSLRKIKIATISARESKSEAIETRAKVGEDRKHQIEACLVRIMKARRSLDHNNLIAEATKQLSSRFQPNPNDIKRRIESLIEREYLERSSSNRKQYRYLA